MIGIELRSKNLALKVTWKKQSVRGTGASQILKGDNGVWLVKGKGYNNFWVAWKDGKMLVLKSKIGANLRIVKADIENGRYY